MRLGVVADLLSGDLARIRVVLASDPGQSNPVRRALEVLRRFTTPARDAPLAIRIPFCPPLALLWHQSDAPRERTPAQRVHHVVLRESWRERSWLQRAAVVARLALVWIPTNVVVSAWSTALNSRAIRARTGKGIARQLAEQAALLVKYDVRAPWYYTFDLHDDALRGSAEDYLSRTETKGGLFLLIKRYLHERGRRSSLADKWLFYEHCQREGLRTMPVLARAEGGALRFLVGDALPPIDLFVKPTNGRGGVGADWWGWDGESGYRSSSGTRLSREELTRHIAELSKGEPYVVAPRLRSHPDLQDLSNGALSTVRIVTARNEHGACEATDAVFRMAVGNNTVIDNFHAGGLAANVDRVTGELSRATDLGLRPDAGWRDTHPHGGRIVGRKVPFWQETTALVEQAHATFDPRVLIGWDVAILADGPCLIEGNGGPDLDIHQRCSRTPTGRTRLGQLLAFHAQRALDARAARSGTRPGAAERP